MPNRKINWDNTASRQFEHAMDYIAEKSLQSAEKVSGEIFIKIENLLTYPEANPLDKYKINNDGHFRAFELHRLRIAYRVSINEIRILRVRSTYQEPLKY